MILGMAKRYWQFRIGSEQDDKYNTETSEYTLLEQDERTENISLEKREKYNNIVQVHIEGGQRSGTLQHRKQIQKQVAAMQISLKYEENLL